MGHLLVVSLLLFMISFALGQTVTLLDNVGVFKHAPAEPQIIYVTVPVTVPSEKQP